MQLTATEEYKGYTIKTFKSTEKEIINIFLGEEPIDYNSDKDEQYEGSLYEKKGIAAAKQHIDELEEKENSL